MSKKNTFEIKYLKTGKCEKIIKTYLYNISYYTLDYPKSNYNMCKKKEKFMKTMSLYFS